LLSLTLYYISAIIINVHLTKNKHHSALVMETTLPSLQKIEHSPEYTSGYLRREETMEEWKQRLQLEIYENLPYFKEKIVAIAQAFYQGHHGFDMGMLWEEIAEADDTT